MLYIKNAKKKYNLFIFYTYIPKLFSVSISNGLAFVFFKYRQIFSTCPFTENYVNIYDSNHSLEEKFILF